MKPQYEHGYSIIVEDTSLKVTIEEFSFQNKAHTNTNTCIL